MANVIKLSILKKANNSVRQIKSATRNCTKMYRNRLLAEFFCKLCTETVFSPNFHGKNALHPKLSNGYAIPHALCSSGNIFADSFKFPPLLDKNRESSPRGVLTPKTFNEIARSLTRLGPNSVADFRDQKPRSSTQPLAAAIKTLEFLPPKTLQTVVRLIEGFASFFRMVFSCL